MALSLLDLPPEVRLQIYHYYVRDCQVRLTVNATRTPTTTTTYMWVKRHGVIEAPIVALRLTCKQLSVEVSEHMLAHAQYVLAHDDKLQMMLL